MQLLTLHSILPLVPACYCRKLSLAGCQVPSKPLYHCPPQQDRAGEKIRQKKKPFGQDKGSLIQQKQRPGQNRRKTKDLFSASYQLVIPSLPLLFLSFYCWTALSGMEYSFAAWVSCPGYVPSQDLAHPLPSVEGGMLERHPWCWVSTRVFDRWTPFQLPVQSTVKAAVGKRTPSPADPVQLPQ